jgi:hypothetical protein
MSCEFGPGGAKSAGQEGALPFVDQSLNYRNSGQVIRMPSGQLVPENSDCLTWPCDETTPQQVGGLDSGRYRFGRQAKGEGSLHAMVRVPAR